ncbi:HypC/HybG/HupF family hydrogenase formation chaperone [bacterium]|nr:HypC/HybG/HupF family hydrogenase formation chaperone [bacterium]
MCLAVPMKVIKVNGTVGSVELSGVTMEVQLTLVPEVKVGDSVIVHAGFALSVIDEESAREAVDLWKDYVDHSE